MRYKDWLRRCVDRVVERVLSGLALCCFLRVKYKHVNISVNRVCYPECEY